MHRTWDEYKATFKLCTHLMLSWAHDMNSLSLVLFLGFLPQSDSTAAIKIQLTQLSPFLAESWAVLIIPSHKYYTIIVATGSPGGMQYDEKNIRRRVYDALNVLMAMGIITKEKKEIFWKGLPQGPQLSLDRLKGERLKVLQKLDQQRRYIAVCTSLQTLALFVTWHSSRDANYENRRRRNFFGIWSSRSWARLAHHLILTHISV